MALMKENIVPINVAEEMSKSFLDYSMSVIISRALPDARDGLKPSQRRILYAMDGLGVQPNRKHVKCAKIVGETMGRDGGISARSTAILPPRCVTRRHASITSGPPSCPTWTGTRSISFPPTMSA